jgi:hypothetical protein
MSDQKKPLLEFAWAAADAANISCRGSLMGYVRPPYAGEWETLTGEPLENKGQVAAIVVREVGDRLERIGIYIAPVALLDPRPEVVLRRIDHSVGSKRSMRITPNLVGNVGHA